jgi:Na+/proline symporter/nitrogen-specific signal transduction histidine kinase
MHPWLIFFAGIAYLGLLFGIATFAEKRKQQGKSIINHPWVYTLSLAVYCTAWTFFGSVGRAATTGIEFITIYLGPTLMAGLFWPVLRKMLLISRVQRLTSIADFISTRYGKNFSVAIAVTLFAVIGLIPYIALQIKSILAGFAILSSRDVQTAPHNDGWITAGLVLLLLVFALLYGARNVDAAEKHEGLVAAIAFESLIKLLAFIAVGLFVTYGLFNGFGDIFRKISEKPDGSKLFTLSESSGYAGWVCMMALSMLAILLLPRQFQMGVVENIQERHVNTATWGLPLYLLLINLFVLPVGFGGLLLLGASGIDADLFVLALPMAAGKNLLALFTWLGGLSAATGMIIVESIALSIMISNNLVLPLLLKQLNWQSRSEQSLQSRVLWIRRLSIAFVLGLAFLYSETEGEKQSLVSIGLISFCAVAQFGPALLGGMFWKQGNHAGAISGMIAGFFIWGYTLVLPGLSPEAIWVQDGPWGIAWLKPHALFGLTHPDQIALTTWWSLFINTTLYIWVSLSTKAHPQEQLQAELFVEVYSHQQATGAGWKGNASLRDIRQLMVNFLGEERTDTLLQGYAKRHQIPLHQMEQADGRLVAFAERVLGGVIGAASSRIMISSMTKEEDINVEEVLNILRENQQVWERNKELRRKQQELGKATQQLEKVNAQLRLMDQQKDEFLYTVTHELRTPLTSIRALSEIVHDNPDLEETERQRYLEAITRETERLSHLITQVLTLEKYESGRHRLSISSLNLYDIIKKVVDNMLPVAALKNISIHTRISDTQPLIQGDGELLTQVMYNLVGNAIKFAKKEIHISLIHDYNEWQVHVRDDGKGIDTDEQSMIFDKFFQARNQTLKKPEGSGLGLAICRKIMDLHAGSIRVESKPGMGANFIVTLPG